MMINAVAHSIPPMIASGYLVDDQEAKDNGDELQAVEDSRQNQSHFKGLTN
jgi:hypothetical protein